MLKKKQKANNTETLWLAMKWEKYILKKNSEPIDPSTWQNVCEELFLILQKCCLNAIDTNSQALTHSLIYDSMFGS